MKKYFSLRAICMAIVTFALFVSCSKKKDDPQPETVAVPPPAVTPPTPIPVYGGSPTNMVSDTIRIAMIKNLVEYAQSAKDNTISNNTLLNKYNNTGPTPFPNPNLNSRTDISISSKVNAMFRDSIEAYFIRLSAASQFRGTASNGTAGNLIDAQGQYKKFFDAQGFAIDELIEKGLAGSVQLYQMCTVNLAKSKITSSDSAANLKNWDYAYAQLGVPLDYGNKDYQYKFPLWGKYLKINDQRLGGSISKILNGFVSGREAILKKDTAATSANAKIIRDEMEKATAGMIMTSMHNVKYFNERNAQQEKLKSLTQVLGFMYVLKNHPTKKIPDAKLDQFIDKLDNNNWTITMPEVEAILSEFSGIYGFNTTYDIKI